MNSDQQINLGMVGEYLKFIFVLSGVSFACNMILYICENVAVYTHTFVVELVQ